MKDINEIEKMSYVEFVSFIQEENRPSGGKKTIRIIAQNSFTNKETNVLEIGCTNGFSSLEISRITGCSVIGIDIDEQSVCNANEKAKKYKIDDKVKFYKESVEYLPYTDDSFDLIVLGNALSFINNKNKAINEILRVVKPSGFISVVPIWYKSQINTDAQKTIDATSSILGFSINPMYKKDWLRTIEDNNLEIYFSQDFAFDKKSEQDIQNYVEKMIGPKDHLKCYSKDILHYVKSRWEKTMQVFYNNLQLTNYSIFLLRKNDVNEEKELFSAHII